jgi:hypothetical protein
MKMTGTTNAPHIPTPEERFWRKVTKTAGCWTWGGYKNPLGYGTFSASSGSRQAHRYSYELANGPIPEGLNIDHICHNPSCVNPDHLRPVTQKQNGENQGKLSRRNTSGYRGVTWVKRRSQWVANVFHFGKNHFVGYFATVEEAAKAAQETRNLLYTHNDLDRRAS